MVPTRQLTDELTAAGERERVVSLRGESRIAQWHLSISLPD